MLQEKTSFVNEVMQKNVISIDITSSVKDAATIMTDAKVGCVVVTKNNAPVGIITERDLVRRVISADKPSSVLVSDVMSSPLITAKPDYNLWELTQLMKTKSLHRIPVEKDNQLVGIVTSTDIVRIHCLATGPEICKITEQIISRNSTKR
ncbi:MAG: cyclic nucleotide-binding/CBS domain-containing protein [Nitrosopumilaceae archaeon]